MTTATALRIARDEWPVLRWRSVIAKDWGTSRVLGGPVRILMQPHGSLLVSTDSGKTWRWCLSAADLRRALRAARYALADV